MCTFWVLHVVVINCGMYLVLQINTLHVFNNVHMRTISFLCFDRCRFDTLCNLVKLNSFTSGKEEVPQNEVLDSAQAEHFFLKVHYI